VAVVAGLAASLFVAACGGARATAPITPPPALGPTPNLLTADDIAHAKAGPERTVLEWAQAVQFSDPRTVLDLFTSRAVTTGGRTRITEAVLDIGGKLGRPEIVASDPVGPNLRRIRAFLVSYDATRAPVYRQPVTFDLAQRQGRWQLADATVLLRTYDDLLGQPQQGAAPGAAGGGS
jgi:hypothetical protein